MRILHIRNLKKLRRVGAAHAQNGANALAVLLLAFAANLPAQALFLVFASVVISLVGKVLQYGNMETARELASFLL